MFSRKYERTGYVKPCYHNKAKTAKHDSNISNAKRWHLFFLANNIKIINRIKLQKWDTSVAP